VKAVCGKAARKLLCGGAHSDMRPYRDPYSRQPIAENNSVLSNVIGTIWRIGNFPRTLSLMPVSEATAVLLCSSCLDACAWIVECAVSFGKID
jgi:hypothetical protein